MVRCGSARGRHALECSDAAVTTAAITVALATTGAASATGTAASVAANADGASDSAWIVLLFCLPLP